MRNPGWLLAVGLLVAGQSCCLAGGKTSQKSPLGKTNFFTAGNGLNVAAVEHLTEYLAQVTEHFAGIGPPVEWAPYPTTAEMFPDWMNEHSATPTTLTELGQARCAENDLNHLAVRLKDDPRLRTSELRQQDGLIRIEPLAASTGPESTSEVGPVFDRRSIYGSGCVIPAG